MEDAENAIERALEKLTDEQKLIVLGRVKARLGVAMKIHTSKLTGTALGEFIVCQVVLDQLGGKLTWNRSTANGVDARNSIGRGVEIKCTDKSAGRGSANYRNPARLEGETNARYRDRVFAHWSSSYPGGHYWVTMTNAYTKVVNVVFVPGLQFASAMADRALTSKKNAHNFGGAWCKVCGRVHRFDAIAESIIAGRGFPTKAIPSQCKIKKV